MAAEGTTIDGDHRLATIAENVENGRVAAFCACKWSSGLRRNRKAALRAIGDHIEAAEVPLTIERARAIQRDHSEGLHEPFDNGETCRWFSCLEAYWLLAQEAENKPWRSWREAQARQDAVGGIT